VRGLFLFADGKPIGKEGVLWLKAHVAARADGVAWSDHTGPRLSELDFAQRVAWTNANSELLLKIGKAVLEGDDPATLDWALPKGECIQFIAACVELVQAWDNPEYETRLPLTFDASCSGLQHLCAMTRDEEGARYVNLIPSEETDDFNVAYQVADDFYRRVAYRVWQYGGPPGPPVRPQAGKAAVHVLLLRRSRWWISKRLCWPLEALRHDEAGDRRGIADQSCEAISRHQSTNVSRICYSDRRAYAIG
jgi:hypothetical protein